MPRTQLTTVEGEVSSMVISLASLVRSDHATPTARKGTHQPYTPLVSRKSLHA